MSRSAPMPCRKCGGPKPALRGRKYCDPCRPQADPERVARLARNRERAAAAADGQRWCPRCENYLPIAQFGQRTDRDRPVSYCIPCQKAYLHENRIKKLYGLDANGYQQLLDLQEGRCAICRCKPRSRVLAVDHDHKSGSVRGLLCTRCNHKVLGAAKENPELLRRAASYLEHPPATTGDLSYLGATDGWMDLMQDLEHAEEKGEPAPAWIPFQPQGSADEGDKMAALRFSDLINLLAEAGYGDRK